MVCVTNDLELLLKQIHDKELTLNANTDSLSCYTNGIKNNYYFNCNVCSLSWEHTGISSCAIPTKNAVTYLKENHLHPELFV